MTDTLRLEVVTPSRRVLEGRASEVRIPGALGELGVLPGHTPLLTSLGTGEVTWFDGNTTGRLVVQGGFAEVQPDAVTVLASIAETVDEIDLEAARATLAEAQEKLKTVDAENFDEVDSQVRLAAARISAAAGGGA
jgi:F-type H+-transporting ATPase subunit epsilon